MSLGDEPHVGIFWWAPEGPGVLVTDRTPLTEAEPYGDFLTHPAGHFEVWEDWRRLGVLGLRRRRLPPAIASTEYETFPRGRIVFHGPTQTFWIYADGRLQVPAVIKEIKAAFGLNDANSVVKSDSHYRT
jgi:hypothetical protein